MKKNEKEWKTKTKKQNKEHNILLVNIKILNINFY